ncbi:MAG TPA: hypothetical protein VFW31_09890 [Candidatus Angelobacter sp.]|nr:hypothetical protein [Candidatus Angelobacter sp.]
MKEAVVDLSGASGLLVSQVVHLNHGRREITFPYDPRFHGQLDITAFAITGSEEKNSDLIGERHILFPGPQELQLALRMRKSRPPSVRRGRSRRERPNSGWQPG